MRPTSSNGNKADRFRLIIIGIVIIAIIAGIVVTLNFVGFGDEESTDNNEKPYFSKAELTKSEIVSDENTLVMLEVTNPSSEFYEDVEIQVSTFSSKIKMSPTNRNLEYFYDNIDVSPNKTRYSIVVSDPLGLGEHESTRTYTFEVIGGLHSGTISSTLEIEANVLVNGEKTDNKTFELKISSKD